MSNFRNEHTLLQRALVFYKHFSEGASSYKVKTRLINSADSRLGDDSHNEGTKRGKLDSYFKLVQVL